MGVWHLDRASGARYIGICEDAAAQRLECAHDVTYSLIFFGVLFTLFALLDCTTMNTWRMNRGLCTNLVFTGRDLFCIAVVAFFGADVGLDVIRDSRYATSSPIWHLSWVFILTIAVVAKIGPMLMCCLPAWAKNSNLSGAGSGGSSAHSTSLQRSGSKGRGLNALPKEPKSSELKKFKEARKIRRRRLSVKSKSAYVVHEESSSQASAAMSSKQQATAAAGATTTNTTSTVTSSANNRGQAWSAPSRPSHGPPYKYADGDADGDADGRESCCCGGSSQAVCTSLLVFFRHLSIRLAKLINLVFHGLAWEMYESYSLIVSVASVVIYVAATYETSAFRMKVVSTKGVIESISVRGMQPVWKQDCPGNRNTPWTHLPQRFLEAALGLDFAIRLLVSRKSRVKTFFSLYMLCDLISISQMPVWVMGFDQELAASFGCLRFLRLLRVRNHPLIVEHTSKIRQKQLKVILTILSLFLVTAGLILTVEYGHESGFVCLHDAVYFSVISLLTVGLGDLAPISFAGRLLSTAMILVGVALVSYQLNELEAASRRQVKFRYTGSLPIAVNRHIILCGDVMRVDSIKTFLEEFCHENHRGVDDVRMPTIILLSPSPPSTELENLLETLMAQDRADGQRLSLYYMQGLPSNVGDLHRVYVSLSKSVFILADPLASDKDRNAVYMQVMLTALAIAKSAPRAHILAQVLLPESISTVRTAGAHVVVCESSLKYSILANSFWSNGISAFISNLARSSDLDGSEYADGCDWELYTVPFSHQTVGHSFGTISRRLFREPAPRPVLVGVIQHGIKSNKTAGEHHQNTAAKAPLPPNKVVMNPPGGYMITAKDEAIVMAVDLQHALEIQELDHVEGLAMPVYRDEPSEEYHIDHTATKRDHHGARKLRHELTGVGGSQVMPNHGGQHGEDFFTSFGKEISSVRGPQHGPGFHDGKPLKFQHHFNGPTPSVGQTNTHPAASAVAAAEAVEHAHKSVVLIQKAVRSGLIKSQHRRSVNAFTDCSDFRNHIVILGTAKSAVHLVKHLSLCESDEDNRELLPPVVVVTLSSDAGEAVRYYAKGNLRSEHDINYLNKTCAGLIHGVVGSVVDLRLAAAPYAAMVVLLSNRQVEIEEGYHSDGMSIRTSLLLRAECKRLSLPEPYVITELFNSTNTLFMDATTWGGSKSKKSSHYTLSPVFSEGRILTSELNDTLLGMSYYVPRMAQCLMLMIDGPSKLRHFEVPEEFEGRRYIDIARYLQGQDTLAVALVSQGLAVGVEQINNDTSIKTAVAMWKMVCCQTRSGSAGEKNKRLRKKTKSICTSVLLLL